MQQEIEYGLVGDGEGAMRAGEGMDWEVKNRRSVKLRLQLTPPRSVSGCSTWSSSLRLKQQCFGRTGFRVVAGECLGLLKQRSLPGI
jgi:hypothetical protein